MRARGEQHRCECYRRPRRSLSDHYVGGFNHSGNAITYLEAKFINSLVRDRRRHPCTITDVNEHMCRRGTFLKLDEFAFELVACTEVHYLSPSNSDFKTLFVLV